MGATVVMSVLVPSSKAGTTRRSEIGSTARSAAAPDRTNNASEINESATIERMKRKLNPNARKPETFSDRFKPLRLITKPNGNVMAGSLLAPSIHELVDRLTNSYSAVGIAYIEDVPWNRLGCGVDKLERIPCRELCQVQKRD